MTHGQYLRDAPTHDRALLIGIDKTACSGFATVGNMGLRWLTGQIGLEPALLATALAILLCVGDLALRGHLYRLGIK